MLPFFYVIILKNSIPLMRNLLCSVFTLISMLSIISCKAQKVNSTADKAVKLSNEWVFEGFFNDELKLVYDSSKSVEIIISPQENFFTGNTGCNAMRGTLTTEPGGKIKFGYPEALNKRCANIETEKRLLQLLECVTNYTIEGAILKLYCNEKAVMQFESYKN